MRTHPYGPRSTVHDPRARRPGQILVIVGLVLTVLVGMVGLVIDAGLLFAAQRQAQNAADAAAMAGAAALQLGYNNATATTAVDNMVTANGLPASPAPTVNIPPKSGNYVGKTGYVEVIVTYPVTTSFIQVLGVSSSQSVTARAVAGSVSYSSNLGIILLNPSANPGLSLSGNGVLKVSDPSGALGGISVYSMYGGETQVPGVTVNFPGYSGGNAVSVSGNGTIDAGFVNVSGGVNNRSAFTSGTLTAGTGNPPVDPLASLPTPTVSNGVTPIYWGQNSNGTFAPAGYWNGSTWMINTLKSGTYTGNYTSSATAPTPQDISIAGNSTATIPPGVYGAISLSGNSNITFAWNQAIAPPGFTTAPATNIYVLTGETSSDLTISGNTSIAGSNMMFYNTGTKYNPLTGDNGSTQFGGANFSGDSSITYTPPTSGPFQNVWFYQSPLNTQTMSFSGNEKNNTINGTVYLPKGAVSLSGNGELNTQIVAASLAVSGNGEIDVIMKNAAAGTLQSVYLVE